GAIDAIDHGRADELVVLPSSVGGTDRLNGTWRPFPYPVNDGRVSLGGTLPALVAIHRVIATAHGRDPHVGMDLAKPLLEVFYEVDRGSRRCVATVEQRVDANRRHALASSKGNESHEVPIVRVDAARTDQRDRV